jgi:murein DD-endopeptidase MepM/ murein hydrolase activator NlpD
MRGRHEKRPRLFGRVGWNHTPEASHRTKSEDRDRRRSLLASILVATLLLVSGTALAAAKPTTTTTLPEATTTTTVDTTTTLVDGTTTTLSETSTTFSSPTTTPSSTTTTLSDPATSTPEDLPGLVTPPELLPPPAEPPDPEPEAVDFKVGRLPAPAIVFPLNGPHSFVDTFGAPRDGGRRRHAGIDIMARRGVPIVAVAAGVVEEIGTGALAGQYVIVRHDNGWRSKYLHLDNDTPGSDDGLGSGYAKGLRVGMRVQAGTVLGFVGDSGNAEHTVPHLHFGLYQPNGLPINPYRALVAAPNAEPVFPTPIASTFNTEFVGQLALDRTGFNADVAVHGNKAYVGTLGNGEVCAGTGVRIIDVSDPAQPEALGAFAGANQFPGTATPSVWVGKVATAFGSQRTLAVVAVQLCDENDWVSVHGRFVGLAIYDVGDPSNPVLLSTVHSGDRTGGVSHVDVTNTGSDLLAAATVPGSYDDHPDSLGDVRVYDLTRPLVVREMSDWHIRQDGPAVLVEGLGVLLGNRSLDATSVSWDSTNRLVVSNSAAGVVTLELSEDGSLRYLASTAADDLYGFLVGPRTSAFPDLAASQGWRFDDALLVQNEYRPQPSFDGDGAPIGWSPQRLFDVSNPAKPRLIAAIGTTRRNGGASILDGIYSPRASVRIGDNMQLVAWLSDGLRVIDLKNPTDPGETAFFVPPPLPDPHGWWVAPDGSRELPLVWDVATDGEYVFVSDVNSGLWVLRITTPVVDRSTTLAE